MEPLNFRCEDQGVHLEGFPDAVKLIKLRGPKAQRLADLGLHRSDLEFSAECLTAINRTTDKLIQQSLWRSAVIFYVKCFGDSASRFQLSPDRVYKSELPAALQTFQFFRELRNKHFVHDENAFSQCLASAVLNRRDHTPKIAKVVCVSMTGNLLCQDNYSNLTMLVEKARTWVAHEFDALADILTLELEAMTYETLTELEAVTQTAPTVNEIGNKRPKGH